MPYMKKLWARVGSKIEEGRISFLSITGKYYNTLWIWGHSFTFRDNNGGQGKRVLFCFHFFPTWFPLSLSHLALYRFSVGCLHPSMSSSIGGLIDECLEGGSLERSWSSRFPRKVEQGREGGSRLSTGITDWVAYQQCLSHCDVNWRRLHRRSSILWSSKCFGVFLG